jgi:hypothetical protein
MSLVIGAVRDRTLDGGPGPPFVPALLWSAVPLVVFVPLGSWLYSLRTTQ